MRAVHIAELGAEPVPVEIDGEGSSRSRPWRSTRSTSRCGRSLRGGHPPLPYVPGCEAVGRRNGERWHLFGDGRGTVKDGFLVERVELPDALAVPIRTAWTTRPQPPAVSPAWPAGRRSRAWPVEVGRPRARPRRDRHGGVDRFAGREILGAERVVAAGRDEAKLRRAIELGADATVTLDGDDLVASFREAFGGDGPTLVVDPVWGEPARAAIEAAAPGARIVQIGQSAGPEATLTSAAIRLKQLSILGFTDFALTREQRLEAYLGLAEHVVAGRIQIDVETFPLADVSKAWSAQQQGRKAVILF